jgi:hypothetical protein
LQFILLATHSVDVAHPNALHTSPSIFRAGRSYRSYFWILGSTLPKTTGAFFAKNFRFIAREFDEALILKSRDSAELHLATDAEI